MFALILRHGLVAGLIVGLPLFGLAVFLKGHAPSGVWGMVVGYLTMLVAFSLIFVAVKQHRDRDRGGVIGFWPAFGMGLAISAVASACYVLAWEAALAATGLDFGAEYSKAQLAALQAKGASAEALAKMKAEMDAFAALYRQPLPRMGMTVLEIFPVGLLVSAVCAGLLRDPRRFPARR